MLPIKIISVIGSTVVVGGGIGAIVHFTSNEKVDQLWPAIDSGEFPKTEEASAKAISLSWKTYLVQVKSNSESPEQQEAKAFCVLESNCKVYESNNDESYVQTKDSNLTKIKDLSKLKEHTYYVLNIHGKELKPKTLVKLLPNQSTNISFEVVSTMSIESQSYKLPKLPKKFIPKKEWQEFFSLNILDVADLSKVLNKHFVNQTYPTHIIRDQIDHNSYMVFKWQDITPSKFLHNNKTRLLYIPNSGVEDLRGGWQKNINNAFISTSFTYNHPWYLGTITTTLEEIDKNLIAIDPYLFKTFEEQKDDHGAFDGITVKFLDNTLTVSAGSTGLTNHSFQDVYLEIYEIEDQENIAKSLPTGSTLDGKSTEVDWTKIDKDNKMITKISEMKHNKYYKFVFSKKEVIEAAIKNPLVDFYAIIHPLKPNSQSWSTSWEFLIFDNFSGDFHCVRTKSQQKCAYLYPRKTS